MSPARTTTTSSLSDSWPVEKIYYQLREVINDDGTAVVHSAFCIPKKQDCEIKIINLDKSDTSLEGVLNEVHNLSCMDYFAKFFVDEEVWFVLAPGTSWKLQKNGDGEWIWSSHEDEDEDKENVDNNNNNNNSKTQQRGNKNGSSSCLNNSVTSAESDTSSNGQEEPNSSNAEQNPEQDKPKSKKHNLRSLQRFDYNIYHKTGAKVYTRNEL